MSDLSKVKEINVVHEMAYANKHLANGWILIAVNSISGNKAGTISISTEYVLGWEDALPSKKIAQYEDAAPSKYAPKYDDDVAVKLKPTKPKPKDKTITIIE